MDFFLLKMSRRKQQTGEGAKIADEPAISDEKTDGLALLIRPVTTIVFLLVASFKLNLERCALIGLFKRLRVF
jgi:hypothetical protein